MTVFPLSRASSNVSSSLCFSINAASLKSHSARCCPLKLRHCPSSKALRAASTARSTSSTPASSTDAMTSSVCGSIVSNLLPEADFSQRPAMNNFVNLGLTLLIVEYNLVLTLLFQIVSIFNFLDLSKYFKI